MGRRSIDAGERFRVYPFEVRQRGVQYLILFPDTARWMRTNDVGTEILRLCEKGLTVEETAEELSSKYGLLKSVILPDVMNFLCEANELGIAFRESEAEKISYNDKPATVHPVLRTLYLHVTDRCNLSCPYCYVDCSSDTAAATELQPDDMKVLLEWMDRDVLSQLNVVLTGGEPLLHPQFTEILRTVREKGAGSITVPTNGTVGDEDLWREALPFIDLVQISLDGPDEETNSLTRGEGVFDRVLRNVEMLQKLNLKMDSDVSIGLCCTVHSGNFERLEEMAELAYEMGCNFLRVNIELPVHGYEGAGERAPERESLIAGLKKTAEKANTLLTTSGVHGREPADFGLHISCLNDYTGLIEGVNIINCGMGCSILSVAPNGDVFPCPFFHRDDFRLGNFREKDMKSIHDASIEKYVKLRKFDFVGCSFCDLQTFCNGGCRARAYQVRGDLKDRDPFCRFNYECLENALWSLVWRKQ